MKMPPIKRPSDEILSRFVSEVAASPSGLAVGPALQGHQRLRDWLVMQGTYLPPELAAMGLVCSRSGRGYRYTCTAPKVQNSVNATGKKRAAKKALESKDHLWFASQVPTHEWLAVIQRIKDAGLIGYQDLLQPYKGSDIFKAITMHPSKLPELFADHGIMYDPGPYTGAGHYAYL